MGKIVLRLDRMMVERKMSLNELAEKVGISNVNLSKIKTTRSPPSASPLWPPFARPWTVRRATSWNTKRIPQKNKRKLMRRKCV